MARKKDCLRSRNIKMLLYPDNPAHENAISSIMNSDLQYVGIMHVGTEETKPHYHIYLCFDNARSCASVAADLGLMSDSGEPDVQFVRPITGRLDNALVYLTHLNTPEKEQYSVSDLIGTGSLIDRYQKAATKYLSKQLDMSDCVLAILDWIQQHEGVITMSAFGRWVCCSPYFRGASSGIVRGAIQEHNQRIYDAQRKKYIEMIQDGQERLQALIAAPELDFAEWEGDLP